MLCKQWGNPSRVYGGASEIERTRWEEKFSDAGDAEGVNPIALVEVRGGQTADAHSRIQHLEKMAIASEARAQQANEQLKTASEAALARIPRSRDKAIASPSTPPAMPRTRLLPDSLRSQAKERYGIETVDQVRGHTPATSPHMYNMYMYMCMCNAHIPLHTPHTRRAPLKLAPLSTAIAPHASPCPQLNARVRQLELKYDIDKVRFEMTNYGRVDTTPQAGHNTSYSPPRPGKAF